MTFVDRTEENIDLFVTFLLSSRSYVCLLSICNWEEPPSLCQSNKTQQLCPSRPHASLPSLNVSCTTGHLAVEWKPTSYSSKDLTLTL